MAAVLTAPSVAAQTSPYYVALSQSFSHDSNLLRLDRNAALQEGQSRADTVSSTSLLAGLDQTLGRQRVYGNLALRSNRLSNNTVYSNETYTAALGLDWATVAHLSGTLSASTNRALSSFNLQGIGTLREKNFEDTRTLDASLRWGLYGPYSLLVSVGQRKVDNSSDAAALRSRDFRQTSAATGLRWTPSAIGHFGLSLRHTRGIYPRFRPVANGFDGDRFERDDLEFSASRQPSAASTLDLRLSSGRTRYDLATQRNFSGLTGSLGWTWQFSGKLRFALVASRDIGQDSYAVTAFQTPASADYGRVNTGLRLTTDYALSSKVALTLTAGLAERKLARSLPTPAGQTVSDSGNERQNVLSLGARWAPRRSMLVGCEAAIDRRRGSGALGSDVPAETVTCYAQISLQ